MMAAWLLLALFFFAVLADADVKDLHLKPNDYPVFAVEVLSQVETSTVTDVDGNRYDLSRLEPHADLFSNKHFVASNDKSSVTDKRTGQSIPVSVFRAVYDDKTVVIAEKNSRGKIVYVEVRRQRGESDLFLVSSTAADDSGIDIEEESLSLVAFTDKDIDEEELQSKFHYAEANIPPGGVDANQNRNRFLRNVFQQQDQETTTAPNLDHREGQKTAALSGGGCEFLRVVRLAIAFDSDFCHVFGSFEATRRRILTIVSSASYHYERDLCVKLDLTDIYTPDSCFAPSIFEYFDRDVPCGSESSFLSRISSWMRQRRSSVNIDEHSTVHLFSGHPPPGGTIGCAYVGSLCDGNYAFGVEYMTFSRSPYSQGVVLAHEMGHVLNAPHLPSSNSYRHVMNASINNADDGFSYETSSNILSFLDSRTITCDEKMEGSPTPTPTPWPSPAPMMNKCTLFEDTSRSPSCMFASSDRASYACFHYSSLLRPRASPACSDTSLQLAISGCFSGDLPKQRRRKNKRNSDDDHMGVPEVFEADTCRETCVVVSEYICLRSGSLKGAHSISYLATLDQDGVGDSFTTIVDVQPDNGSDNCVIPATYCEEA